MVEKSMTMKQQQKKKLQELWITAAAVCFFESFDVCGFVFSPPTFIILESCTHAWLSVPNNLHSQVSTKAWLLSVKGRGNFH